MRRRVEIKRAGQITAKPEADEDTDRRRHRNGKHHTDKAKRGTAGEQSKNHPDCGEFHPVAEKPWIDHIPFKNLARDQDADYNPNLQPIGELRQCEANCRDAAGL